MTDIAVCTHLLVSTDFSDCAGHALDYAMSFARKVGARVTILHAYQIPVVGFPDGAFIATAEMADKIVNSAASALDATIAKRKGKGVPIDSILRCGDPSEQIGLVAQEIGADLIVMGTHGRRGVSRALLGSVAEHVVRTSSLPVLTIRASSPRPPAGREMR